MKALKALVLSVIFILICLGILCALESFTNRQIWDTTYSFERAVIAMPDGHIVEGRVDSWKDFDDADQIQVKISGKTYLTHISNVVLISE